MGGDRRVTLCPQSELLREHNHTHVWTWVGRSSFWNLGTVVARPGGAWVGVPR